MVVTVMVVEGHDSSSSDVGESRLQQGSGSLYIFTLTGGLSIFMPRLGSHRLSGDQHRHVNALLLVKVAKWQ